MEKKKVVPKSKSSAPLNDKQLDALLGSGEILQVVDKSTGKAVDIRALLGIEED